MFRYIYACILTRGVYMVLLPASETEECIRSLNKCIGRRRETGTSLFRQWHNNCWCCEVGQGSDERRATPQLPVSQPDQVAA